jgi:hypothetical protein
MRIFATLALFFGFEIYGATPLLDATLGGLEKYLKSGNYQDAHEFTVMMVGHARLTGERFRIGEGIYEAEIELYKGLVEKVCVGDRGAIEIAAIFVSAIATDGAEGESRYMLAGYLEHHLQDELKKVRHLYRSFFKKFPYPSGFDLETSKKLCIG